MGLEKIMTEHPFDYFDEYPQDDPFTWPDETETLAYKDELVTNLKEQIDEYLTFGTPRELFKLIADVL
jgi:hypothetical protein